MHTRSYQIPMQDPMDVPPPSGGTKKILMIPSILSKKNKKNRIHTDNL